MEYCCHEYCCRVCAGAPSWYLELLDKLQKCMGVGLSFVASLEPLADCRNVASLSLFYMYYFGTLVDVHLNWSNCSTSLFSREIYLLFRYIAQFLCRHS